MQSSQHFGFVHSAGLGNISLARQNRCLHTAHVLATCTDRHTRCEVAVVHHAFPRVIPLPVLLNQRVILFFLLCIIGATQLNLPVSLCLPLLQRDFSSALSLALRLLLSLLLLEELGLAGLIAGFSLRHALQLFLSVVVISVCWFCGLGHERPECVIHFVLRGAAEAIESPWTRRGIKIAELFHSA